MRGTKPPGRNRPEGGVRRCAAALLVALLPVAGGATQVCRWTTPEGQAAFGAAIPPGAVGSCQPAPVAAPVPTLADQIEQRAALRGRMAAKQRNADELAARQAIQRAADLRDKSIESLILRARARRALAGAP